MVEGGCNCGQVRWRIEGEPLAVVACHCTSCRRQAGAAYSVNLIVPPAAMTVDGELTVWEDRDTASGAPVLRQFCGVCGSPIRSVITASSAVVAVKAGTADAPGPYAPQMHVFTRSKLPWVEIPAGLPAFEGNPG
jgi:hypothetical protein